MDLVSHVWRNNDEQNARDRPHVNVVAAFMLEILSGDIPESVLVVSIGRELVQGFFEEKEMSKEKGVTRSHRLCGLVVSDMDGNN